MFPKRFKGFDPIVALTVVLVLAAAVALLLTLAGAAQASSGGVGETADSNVGKVQKAKLRGGRAIPPANAPKRVVKAIKAANRIRNKPYVYGGGHGSFRSKGYDCSGAVSYALHGARMLDSPLDSGSLMSWGRKGKGKWITVYAHGGHTYAIIAGLRWDTSMTAGNGPGWSKQMRSKRGYAVRHYQGY